jgi:hypothetical protein
MQILNILNGSYAAQVVFQLEENYNHNRAFEQHLFITIRNYVLADAL